MSATAGDRRERAPCPAGKARTPALRLCAFASEAAMAQQDAPLRAKGLGEPLGEVDGAVTPAGAADGHGNVAAVLPGDRGKPARQQRPHVLKPALDRGVA